MKPKSMTAKQFSQTLTLLGYNQSSFARHIDISDRMVRNWVSGAFPVPRHIALLVGLMLETNATSEPS